MAGRWSRPETCWNNSFLTERCVNAVVAIASKINLSEGRASRRASGIEDHEKTRTANLHHLYHEALPEDVKLTPRVEVDNVHQRRTTDVYEHALTITARQQIYDQLHRVNFMASSRKSCLMRFRCSVNTPARRCVSRVWFGQTLSGLVFRDARRTGIYRRAGLGSAEIATRPGGTEFELSTPDDYTILGVVISEDVISRQATFCITRKGCCICCVTS